jgi:hypothetical protein
MERDAFGREKGEDSLAGMGWSSSAGSPAAAPTPTPAQPVMSGGDLPPNGPAPAWTPGPRQSYVRRRRRSAFGVIVPLFVIGFVALAVGGSIFAFNAGSNAVDSITSTIESATSGTTTTTTSTGRKEASGTSLMDRKALRAALAQLPKGDIELLRLAPDRLDANVIVGGKMHVVQVSAGGDVRDITTPSTGRDAPVKVNTAAPMRIARTAAKRAGRRPSDIDYLVLIHLLGKDEWQLYFKGDALHYAASANGKKVHKVG